MDKEDSIDLVIDEMLRDNERRKQELFPEFNQFTGEGCPGERTWIEVEDLCGGVRWYVPTVLINENPLWSALAFYHSVSAYCYACFGRTGEDLRENLITQLLRSRAKHDVCFFFLVYWRIRPKDFGDNIPFKLRAVQMRFIALCEEMRLSGKPLRYIILKARQAGISTLIDAYIGWYQIMWEKSKDSLIVGHQSDASVEVEDMYKTAINLLPDYLFYEPGEEVSLKGDKITGSKTQNISHIPARNCKIKTGSAVNPEGARGGASSLIHYTEVAFWPETGKIKPRNLIKSATSATGGRPGTMVFFESTPNGQNFYKDEWDRAGQYDDYGEKVSAYYQFFIAWWHIDLYRTTPPDMRQFCRQLIERRDDKNGGWQYLYWLWTIGATLEGIYWYYQTRKEYQSADDMQQEFPSDPIEAFKYAGRLEYDLYLCEKRKKSCRQCQWRGDIEGDAPKGELSVRNLRFFESEAGCLQVWAKPDKKLRLFNRYLISVDIGGKYATSDWSVITVFDRAPMMLDKEGHLNENAGPVVVAEWRGHVDPDLLAIKCAQLAIWYNNAILVIENNTAYSRYNGTANDDVTELFFPVLLPLYTENLYRHNQSETKVTPSAETRWGFNTNRNTKTAVVKYLGQCLRDNTYVEREKGAIDEMETFMKYPNGTFGAVEGKHDDRVMSRAIGLYVSRFEWDKYPVRPMPTRKQREESRRRVNARRNLAANVILNH